jgi:hypothetical protein
MVPLCDQQLTDEQITKLQSLVVTQEQSVQFEKETRLQANCDTWFSLRQTRLTASKIEIICKRRKDHKKLCEQLRRKVRPTKAMAEGSSREPEAAIAYNELMGNTINLYSCGLVISPTCYWIAASPDRKVYNPTRQPPHGLLEIKCPQYTNVQDIKYLIKDVSSSEDKLVLKKTDDYYYQIMCQLAVTGLMWCDFFVYLSSGDYHLETIYFDEKFWQEAQAKVNSFFFDHYLMYDADK